MTAFGFDFDHTLGVDNGLERRAFFRYALELGVPLDARDAGTTRAIDDALVRARSGETTVDEAVRAFFAERGVAAEGERWREHCFRLVPELVRALPGARELLDRIRGRGIPLAILTNGWTPLQERKIEAALGAERVPEVLVSDRIGALKPSRTAFDALVAALGVPHRDVWYVGDNPEGDVAGALAAGLRAVWVDEGLSYPQHLPPPTLRVAKLRELERLVENTHVP